MFVCYNRKGHLSRLLFVSKLVKQNLLERGNVSFLNQSIELPPSDEMWELFDSRHYSITEEEYNTKLQANEEVYLACFVGCTYHCG